MSGVEIDDTVCVQVCASQVVHFKQTYQMPRTDWKAFLDLVARDAPEKEFRALAEKYIDFGVVAFTEDLEDIDFIKYGPKERV